MMYLLLLVGFVLLIKGADFFVDGSSSVARLLGVPGVVVGLTVVAMGTSAPEAAVSITAGIAGSNAIAVSNVIGSNLFNMLVVAGVCAAIKAYDMDADILKRDFPVNVVASVLLLALVLIGGTLSRVDGVILLAAMAAYLIYVVRDALKNRHVDTQDETPTLTPLKSAIYIICGLIAIIFGGNLVVDNATLIATSWGWSETFIGLTIIAIGTSLPELVTSVVAAGKGESGLALGNVIGSNIFNIMLILGLSSTLSPIPVDAEGLRNIVLLVVATIGLFAWCRAKKELSRPAGVVCVSLYLAYSVFLIVNI